MTPRIVAITIAIVALAATPAASAQDGDASDSPAAIEARRVFLEGRAHEAAQRYALAAERYQQAHEIMRRAALERAAVALYWAGRALYHVPGRERDARDAFESFIESSTLLTEDSQVRDWRSEALERIAELDARIGSDSNARALSSPESEPESEPVETETTRSISPVGPVVLGAGGATLLVGAIVAGVALAQNSQLDGLCPDGMCPDTPELRDRANEMLTLSAVADALWIGGAVLSVVGLTLTFVLEEDSDTTVTARCGPFGCVAAVAGAF